jgi:hypothetical protein
MKILAKVFAGIRLLSARMVARWIRGPDEWDASALSWVVLYPLHCSFPHCFQGRIIICDVDCEVKVVFVQMKIASTKRMLASMLSRSAFTKAAGKSE